MKKIGTMKARLLLASVLAAPMLCCGQNTTMVSVPAAHTATAFPMVNEIPMTLEEFTAWMREVPKIQTCIASDVYGNKFYRSTHVYIHGARTAMSAVDDFVVAAGLRWRMDGNGVVQIYRSKPIKCAWAQQ